jgi:hypothetical protein
VPIEVPGKSSTGQIYSSRGNPIQDHGQHWLHIAAELLAGSRLTIMQVRTTMNSISICESGGSAAFDWHDDAVSHFG